MKSLHARVLPERSIDSGCSPVLQTEQSIQPEMNQVVTPATNQNKL